MGDCISINRHNVRSQQKRKEYLPNIQLKVDQPIKSQILDHNLEFIIWPQYISNQENIDQTKLIQKYGPTFKKCDKLIQIKVPANAQGTSFKFIKQNLWIIPSSIRYFGIEDIRSGYFQQKMTWFRFQIQSKRLSWQNGCETLIIDRHNVLMSSLKSLQKVNLKKQVKIQFDDEIVEDAGGVLREWMHLCIKQIFNFAASGLFELCNAQDTAYRIANDPSQDSQVSSFKLKIAELLGLMIGKALFQRRSLNCYLTSSLWRQICGQSVKKADFINYDSQMYKNVQLILKQQRAEDLQFNFSYYVSIPDKNSIVIDLIQNGRNIKVTDGNKQQYIDKLIQYLCIHSCNVYVRMIKQSINRVLPIQLLSIFQPHQIEVLINGPPYINVDQWKRSTKYNGYSSEDVQIVWFWDYVQKLKERKLGNLLHYITGSRRVPVLGFFFLESNRNKINRFQIQKVEYEKQNPYPKSHTCFNRLDLPVYATRQELKQRMDEILANQINSFGLD